MLKSGDVGRQLGRRAQHLGWQLLHFITIQTFSFPSPFPFLSHVSLLSSSFVQIKSSFSCAVYFQFLISSTFSFPQLPPSPSLQDDAICPNHVKSIHRLKLPLGCCDAPLACCIVSRLRLLTVWRLIKLHCALRTETGDRLK